MINMPPNFGNLPSVMPDQTYPGQMPAALPCGMPNMLMDMHRTMMHLEQMCMEMHKMMMEMYCHMMDMEKHRHK